MWIVLFVMFAASAGSLITSKSQLRTIFFWFLQLFPVTFSNFVSDITSRTIRTMAFRSHRGGDYLGIEPMRKKQKCVHSHPRVLIRDNSSLYVLDLSSFPLDEAAIWILVILNQIGIAVR